MNENKRAIDLVVNNLINTIRNGKYSIGDRLPTEKELCKIFDVSRSTLREATSVVRALGYIETRHGSGSYIVETNVENNGTVEQWFALKKSQLNDFFEVRFNVEIMNIRYAILRRSDEDIEQIKNLYNSFENAIVRSDVEKMAILDEKFHMELAIMSDNRLLIEINRLIANALKPYRRKSFALEENVMHALFSHKKILDALENQDVAEGIQAMQDHMDISLKDIDFAANKANERKRE